MAMEKTVELTESLLREPKLASKAFHEHASGAPADEKPDIVAQNGTNDGCRNHPRQRQAPEMCHRSASEKHSFPRHREPCVLEHYANEHGAVPISRKEIDDPLGHY
jgi:hypothetical protein